LIKDLLDVSALESGGAEIELEPIDLNDFIEQRLTIYSAAAEQKEIKIHFEPAAELVRVQATPIAWAGYWIIYCLTPSNFRRLVNKFGYGCRPKKRPGNW
jgi:signal transduction histidine kinase